MITRMPELPANVVGLVASAQITEADYQSVVLPEVEKVAKDQQKIRVLYQFEETFEGFTFGAMWADLKMGLAYFRRWEKIAVVSDKLWLIVLSRIMGYMMPCRVKVFDSKATAAAKRWILA